MKTILKYRISLVYMKFYDSHVNFFEWKNLNGLVKIATKSEICIKEEERTEKIKRKIKKSYRRKSKR